MADELSLVLWSLAEYFNYTAVALIILCSTIMTVFIIRMNAEQWGLLHNGRQHFLGASFSHQKDVTAFTNPFFVTLASTPSSSLSDGLWVEVSCLLPCEVHVYWGASINPVHASLLKKGTDFEEEVHRGVLLSDNCLAEDLNRVERAGKHELYFSRPECVSEDSLGPSPRQRYPCVVVMCSQEAVCTEDYTTVVALVTLFHLKDSKCQMGTHIIAQYAKMAADAIFNLQPLFFASLSDEHGETDDQEEDQQTSSSSPSTSSPSTQAYSCRPDSGDQLTCSKCSQNRSSGDTSTEPAFQQPASKETNVHQSGARPKHDNTERSSKSKERSRVENCSGQGMEKEEGVWREGAATATAAIMNFGEVGDMANTDSEAGEELLPLHDMTTKSLVEQNEKKVFCAKCGDRLQLDHSEAPSLQLDSPSPPPPSPQRQESQRPQLPECIICQTRQLRCVLLPCRHACVCGVCFPKLDRCPMCRSHVESYFMLTDDDDEDDNNIEETSEPVPMDVYSRFERFNHRVNAFFGFDLND